MSGRWPLLGLLVLLGSGIGLALLGWTRPAAPAPADERYFPALPPPRYLYVLDARRLTDAERVMIQTLQGLLAQEEPRIYLEAGPSDRRWLADLIAFYDIGYEVRQDPWWYVAHFAPAFQGRYLLYRLGEDSENVATALAGVLRAIAIAEPLEPQAQAHGLTRLLDLRGRDEAWLLEHYGDLFRRDLVIEQKESIHGSLRDYGPAVRALTFYDGNSPRRLGWLARIRPGGAVLGWGDPTPSEEAFVRPASQLGLVTIPADYARNLSVLSAIQDRPRQKPAPAEPWPPGPYHYVTFLMSDGDNVQWLLNDFALDPRWYGSPVRGRFPMGWTVSPALAELAPSVLRRLYQDAAEGPGRDVFVAGVSGLGYFYPEVFPAYGPYLPHLTRALERADLHLVTIMGLSRVSLSSRWLDDLARSPAIAGFFYLNLHRYHQFDGQITWVQGKPVVAARENLWAPTTPAEVAARLNQRPVAPTRPEGYSLVNVHPWSRSLADVAEVVQRLAPHVRVVPPDVFIALIRQQVGPGERGLPLRPSGSR
jgi:hypothetical protein